MLVISSELKKFKDEVSSGIGNMNSSLTTLTEKLTELSSACSSAQSGFSSYYNSANKTTIISEFSSINELLTSVSNSLTNDLKSMLTKSQELIDKIIKLESLQNEVETQENIKNNEISKEVEKRDSNIISNADYIITKDTTEFNNIKDEADSLFNELKAMDKTLELDSGKTSQSIAIGDVKIELQGLKEGTYNKVQYKAKNGKTITSYIYLPIGASTKEGLGVSLSMGGDGSTGNGLNAGVGKQLKQGANYSGIVVVLEAEDGKSYSNSDYLDASKELADNLVKTYNADPNKVSISGYSYGGSGVQHMIERFPGYFSQAVILAQGTGAIGRESSSRQEALEKLKKTKIHLICGTADSNNYNDLKELYNQLKNSGGQVTCEWRNGADHGINSFHPITVNGVTYDNYVEFCLAQTKNS